MNTKTMPIAMALLASAAIPGVSAQSAMHHSMKRSHSSRKMVAYDAKDKRYYSVAYAKSHGMHDKGGDPLTIVTMSSLPKEAKESRAMHGAKM